MVAGTCLGVMAKLRPFTNSVVSSSVMFLSERLIIQLVVSDRLEGEFSVCLCNLAHLSCRLD